jgi:hypothetical protein
MVLIGCRQEPKLGRTSETRHWYLLQNTWMSMPLLEVSAEFLALHMQGNGDCTCGITFVKERLRATPPHLSVSESGGCGLVFESSIVGGNNVAYNGARKKGSKNINCSEKGERGIFYKSSVAGGDVVVYKSAPETAPKETNCCVCS